MPLRSGTRGRRAITSSIRSKSSSRGSSVYPAYLASVSLNCCFASSTVIISRRMILRGSSLLRSGEHALGLVLGRSPPPNTSLRGRLLHLAKSTAMESVASSFVARSSAALMRACIAAAYEDGEVDLERRCRDELRLALFASSLFCVSARICRSCISSSLSSPSADAPFASSSSSSSCPPNRRDEECDCVGPSFAPPPPELAEVGDAERSDGACSRR